MAATNAARPREVVLVGGGHTHVQVLRSFAMEPPPRTRLTLVVDDPIAVYSGMVPGFVAGQYRSDELEIDVVPLARRARARVILTPATAVDAAARRVHLAGRPPIRYDLASLDVGSTVADRGLPGVAEHAFPTRPIGRFVDRFDEVLERARDAGGRPFRAVIVGAGAGGVELAFTCGARLRRAGVADVRVTLVEAGEEVLQGYAPGLVQRVRRAAERAGILVLTGSRVAAAEADALVFEDGSRLPADVLFWVTGAAGHAWLSDSGLDTDSRGFVWTRPTLQTAGHDDLFAVGDCATLREHPDTPKAGVYAVRQGPYLIHNLRAALAGTRLREYVPQRDFLTLLNLGDGTAVGAKRGLAFEGRWVMTLKDRIDRRFMRRFQVLTEDGDLSREFPRMEGMEMLCGGCAAKVGQSVLDRALARLDDGADDPTVVMGLAQGDDAAAYRTPSGDLQAASLDVFRAFTDDPYLVGRVAAVNAVSDLYAKGVEPRHALALVALDEEEAPEEAEETLYQVLAGMRATLDPLGVTLVGGHTTTAAALMAGLSVEGPAAEELLAIDGLVAGQRLVLTKPLGTGVLFHADMQGLARGPWIAAAIASMLRPNRDAALTARRAGATAATDVTGFGLAGHLGAMLRRSGVSARLDLATLPALPGAVELLGRGLRSTFHPENERGLRGLAVARQAAADPRLGLLFDPQTAGGLVFGLPPDRVEDALAELRAAGDEAAVIGEVLPARDDGAPIEVVA